MWIGIFFSNIKCKEILLYIEEEMSVLYITTQNMNKSYISFTEYE